MSKVNGAGGFVPTTQLPDDDELRAEVARRTEASRSALPTAHALVDGVEGDPAQLRLQGRRLPGDGIEPPPQYMYARANDASSPDDPDEDEPIDGAPESIVIIQTPEPEPISAIPGPDPLGNTTGGGGGWGGGGGPAVPPGPPIAPPVAPPEPEPVRTGKERPNHSKVQHAPDKQGEMKDPRHSAETGVKPDYTIPKFKDGKVGNTDVTVSLTIQTTYKDLADRDKPSGYGKGGTLGQHEALHHADLEAYIASHPPPQGHFRDGMSQAEYDAEVARFRAALQDYALQAQADTQARTD
jgi:hypothetical protein